MKKLLRVHIAIFVGGVGLLTMLTACGDSGPSEAEFIQSCDANRPIQCKCMYEAMVRDNQLAIAKGMVSNSEILPENRPYVIAISFACASGEGQ